jgi:hypothetical protein
LFAASATKSISPSPISRQATGGDFRQVIEYASPFFNGRFSRGDIDICKHHIRGFLGDIDACNNHRHADVSSFQRRAIINTSLSSDHHNLDTGILAGLYGSDRLHSRRIA